MLGYGLLGGFCWESIIYTDATLWIGLDSSWSLVVCPADNDNHIVQSETKWVSMWVVQLLNRKKHMCVFTPPLVQQLYIYYIMNHYLHYFYSNLDYTIDVLDDDDDHHHNRILIMVLLQQ